MGLVWLASYPKSGNTWLRFMLYAYMFGPPAESIHVAQRIPDIHREVPGQLPPAEIELIKTHFKLSDEHPRINETTRAIHIVRNPRDVVLSALNYRKLTGQGSRVFTEGNYIRSFIKAQGDLDWLRLGFGTWIEHARTWRSTEKFPVLALRYEDLKANPASGLRAMIEFLDIELDESRIEQAVQASSFDTMRAMEIREKEAPVEDARNKRLFVGDTKATRKGIYFVNTGASGQSLASISPRIDELFTEAFAEPMRELGYEP